MYYKMHKQTLWQISKMNKFLSISAAACCSLWIYYGAVCLPSIQKYGCVWLTLDARQTDGGSVDWPTRNDFINTHNACTHWGASCDVWPTAAVKVYISRHMNFFSSLVRMKLERQRFIFMGHCVLILLVFARTSFSLIDLREINK